MSLDNEETKPAESSLTDDLSEFLRILNQNDVQYLIIGGYAVMMHTREARATKDLDVWVRQSEENAEKLSKAIAEFSGASVEPGAFLRKGQRLEIGEEPYKIELWTSQERMRFEDAWERHVKSSFGAVEAHLISRADLVELKKHFDREQDRLDVKRLQNQS